MTRKCEPYSYLKYLRKFKPMHKITCSGNGMTGGDQLIRSHYIIGLYTVPQSIFQGY